MNLKSTKTKVLSGVVAVGLLSSVGAAFASTDAGTNLQQWYNSKFGQAAQSIQDQSIGYATNKIPALEKEYKQLKNDNKTDINGTRDTSIGGAQTNVTNAKTEHLTALNTTKADIESHLQSQFDGISQAANTIIGQVGNQVYTIAEQDLTTQTGDLGTAALTKVDKELKKSNEAALKDLQKAIADAKAELQGQIDEATASRVDRIKGMIDAKIGELRGKINTKADELVAAQQKLITDAAQQLEDQAKADMDAAVAGINQ